MEAENEEMAASPRRLPTLVFEGEEYFIDNRLQQFRTVTPPMRLIEFDEPRGRRMLEACVWLGCGKCMHRFAVSRQSVEAATWCPECRRRVIIPEAFRARKTGQGARSDHADPPS